MQMVVFRWSLSLQVSGTLLNILANFNNAVVCLISIIIIYSFSSFSH